MKLTCLYSVAICLIDATPNGFFMHEWALAEAIITAVIQIAVREGLREVTEVTVKVGELQQVELDILKFAFSQLKTANFENAEFRITRAKTTLKCRACGNKWLFKKQKLCENIAEAIHFVPEVAHSYIKCRKCGSPDFKIKEGRGVWLENIKGTR